MYFCSFKNIYCQMTRFWCISHKMCDKMLKSRKKKRVTFKLDTPSETLTTDEVDVATSIESKSKLYSKTASTCLGYDRSSPSRRRRHHVCACGNTMHFPLLSFSPWKYTHPYSKKYWFSSACFCEFVCIYTSNENRLFYMLTALVVDYSSDYSDWNFYSNLVNFLIEISF